MKAGQAELQRHDWVRLDPACAEDAAPRDQGLTGWLKADGRVVVRRADPPVPTGHVALAVVLAEGGARRRVAFSAPASALLAREPNPTLRQAVTAAPDAWQARLARVDEALREVGLVAQVYGSLAWQWISGRDHLHADSDVDLLLRPADEPSLVAALRLLAAYEGEAPRLDGEVVFPGGAGVAWRELAARRDRVLVKSLRHLELRPPADLGDLLRAVA